MKERYEALANAIIVQAAEDYKAALRQLRQNPRFGDALRVKVEVERFFRSNWFGVLTTLDGEWLIEALRKEAA